MEENVAAVTLRERDKQSREGRVVLHIMTVGADYANNFHVVRRTILRRDGVAHMLADSVFVREELLRHLFVDDGDPPPLFVLALGLSEIAATQ